MADFYPGAYWKSWTGQSNGAMLMDLWRNTPAGPHRDVVLCEIWARIQTGKWDCHEQLPADLAGALMFMAAWEVTPESKD